MHATHGLVYCELAFIVVDPKVRQRDQHGLVHSAGSRYYIHKLTFRPGSQYDARPCVALCQRVDVVQGNARIDLNPTLAFPRIAFMYLVAK